MDKTISSLPVSRVAPEFWNGNWSIDDESRPKARRLMQAVVKQIILAIVKTASEKFGFNQSSTPTQYRKSQKIVPYIPEKSLDT
ncbi:hypothetical protein NPIL_237731 [Nephila pilipes]|uniref:Uncharacterized protein n=1 Tax=Nephila pilipes TaxID=299642 RepID=A0A8X6NGM3_NEPPI|nr:hypothetical protein NPIL_237731 [Nephila pilipes]